MSEYILGNRIRCSGRFTDASGAYIDPSPVQFKFKTPADVITTYTYPADAQIVKDATGRYHVDVDASTYGVWFYRFIGLGAGTSADEKSFSVPKSEF